MAKNHESVLWVVGINVLLAFRTRQAAREYVAARRRTSPKYIGQIRRLTWGPDNIKAKAK